MARVLATNTESAELETQVMRDVCDQLDVVCHDTDAMRRVVRYVADRYGFIVEID
jgi:hypothetical protein